MIIIFFKYTMNLICYFFIWGLKRPFKNFMKINDYKIISLALNSSKTKYKNFNI